MKISRTSLVAGAIAASALLGLGAVPSAEAARTPSPSVTASVTAASNNNRKCNVVWTGANWKSGTTYALRFDHSTTYAGPWTLFDTTTRVANSLGGWQWAFLNAQFPTAKADKTWAYLRLEVRDSTNTTLLSTLTVNGCP